MTRSPANLPFFRIGPARPVSPVVLSVPHAGRDYRPELLAAARLGKAMLETLEDRLVDRLVWRATAAGATAFIARAPRAEIDLNRDEREIDPAMIEPPLASGGLVQSARTRGGLGLVPSRIAGAGPIWRERLTRAELNRRIEDVHQPFHRAIEETLSQARDRFGAAILLDCHSMPPRRHLEGDEPRHRDLRRPPRHHDRRRSARRGARRIAGRLATGPPAMRLMPAAMWSAATAARARAFTPSRSSSTARSISTPTCAPRAPASKAPAA